MANDKSPDPNDVQRGLPGDSLRTPGLGGVSHQTLHDSTLRDLKADSGLQAALPNISCEALDTAIGVISTIVQASGNVWIKMGATTILALLNGAKSLKGCP